MLERLVSYVRGLMTRGRARRELDEELQFHLEHEIQTHLARGVSPAEARRMALRDLGGLTQIRESVRDVRSLWIDAAWRDVRYALRRLQHPPAFAAAAILTLALGIGANTAIFSMVDATVLRPLPYEDANRLVQFSLREPQRGISTTGIGPRDFLDWREQQRVFDRIAAYLFRPAVLIGGGEPLEIDLGMVTAGFFETLRTAPAAGRVFVEGDEARGRHQVAVLTHRFWPARFGAGPDVLGRSLQINGLPYEVIGVGRRT